MSSGGKLRGKPGERLEEAHKFFPPFIPLQCSPLVKAEKDWMVSPSYHLSGKQFPGADLYFKSRDDQHVVGSEAGGHVWRKRSMLSCSPPQMASCQEKLPLSTAHFEQSTVTPSDIEESYLTAISQVLHPIYNYYSLLLPLPITIIGLSLSRHPAPCMPRSSFSGVIGLSTLSTIHWYTIE